MIAEVAGGVWLQWCKDTGLETGVNLFSASALLLSAGVALCGRVLCALGYRVACQAHSQPTSCQGHSLPHNQLWLAQAMDTHQSLSVQVSTSGINTRVL